MTWARLLVRHLRISGARWAVLAAVVALTSALAMVWPRWLQSTATDELRRDLGAASSTFVDPAATPRWIAIRDPESALATSEQAARVWQPVEAALTAHRAALPEPLRGLLGDPAFWMTWEPLSARDPGVADRGLMFVQPAIAPQLLEHARIVEGRMPSLERPRDDDCLDAAVDGEQPPLDTCIDRLEIAMSQESARELRWPVGDTRPTAAVDVNGHPIEVVLVGTFEADDPTSSYWQNAAPLLRPTFSGTNETGPVVTARGLISAGAGLQTVAWTIPPDGARLWFPFKAGSVESANAVLLAQQLSTDLRDVPIGDGSTHDFVSDAPARIDEVLARARAATSVLALTVAAPAGVLLALLALAAQVVVAPRRGAHVVVGLRGSSLTQHRMLLACEAALVCLPASALGGAAARLIMPDQVSPWWWLAPAALALAPVVALATSSPTPRAATAGRTAVEAGVTLLTAAAVVQLAVRGVDGSAGTNVVVVAAPLLLTVVAALACVRLVPLLLRPLAERLRHRDELVAPLGAALAARRPVPMTATVATVAGTAVAILGVLVTSTLDAGRAQAAIADIGADVRVLGQLDDAQITALQAVPGVAEVAPVATSTSVALQIGDSHILAKLFVVGPELASVQKDVVGAVTVPGVGGLVTSDTMHVHVGDSAQLATKPHVSVTVVAIADAAPGLTGAQSWMVVNRASVAGTDTYLGTTGAYLALDPHADPATVAAAVREVVGPDVTVATARERLDQLRTAPTARALSLGILVVVAAGLIAAMLAVALALADRSASRTRVVAVLRTMGLPPRAEVRLVLWEMTPMVAVAVVAGVGPGFGLTGLLLATTDVRPFTGGAAQPGLVVDPTTLVGAILIVLVVAAVAVVVSALAAARRSAAVVLRAGEERT